VSVEIAAVLRSWEDRFGARLLEVGYAAIRVLVSRPPQTSEAAQLIAAEHFAFCDEAGRTGLRGVGVLRSLTAAGVRVPGEVAVTVWLAPSWVSFGFPPTSRSMRLRVAATKITDMIATTA